MEISVQDNVLVSYEVLCERREIRLHTSFRGQDCELTDIIFTGVEAYHFAHDNFSTIVFDIIETTAEDIVGQERARFDEGRPYCWPGIWNESPDSAVAYLRERGCRGFWGESSYGMSGWILATGLDRVSRNPVSSGIRAPS